jgi:hypothetical protein
MARGYVGQQEDYSRRIPGRCGDMRGVRTMLSIVGHIMHNYEKLEAEGRTFYEP